MPAPSHSITENAPPCNDDASNELEATSPMIPPTPPSMPPELEESILVAYRSVGIGTFGVVMRFIGMPLEKIALFMNSSQVTGANPIRQSVKLTFAGGAMAPYRVVGPASLVAWFMQYSVMGLAFQFFDHALSKALGVKPVWYGEELMLPPPSKEEQTPSPSQSDPAFRVKSTLKTILAPVLAGSLESTVANRAEVQRYFGPAKFASIETKLAWSSPLSRLCAPAFLSNAMRNVIMCNTSFIITPITYKLYYPQEKKSKSSLFWYGMGMNFAGNAVAITQQALWGRALDYCAENGGRNIKYGEVIRNSLKKEGMSAFFTVPKWGSRILMNAPVQGSLPWFYNNVLPLGEGTVLGAARWVVCSMSKGNQTAFDSADSNPGARSYS
eukprot:CAMPEP_0171332726 /NCGR_PEP_ID=MMETSP0878-20121228/3557_1 /TAXON_ID=67004 /ORGANISM="Thalassiosira weissflogii, Strain CCMP1336" /LENGTH=383 /DNA_ID=CAMNT_0011833531 /DNA_START=198 /DNA_END=1349 /DNA_ORIENTATION=-